MNNVDNVESYGVVECNLINEVDMIVSPNTKSVEENVSVRKKLGYDEINNENYQNITEGTEKNVVDLETCLSDKIPKSRETMLGSWKRKVNQILRMKGDPYLGYRRSRTN
ncbi:hypothetical protein QTP88_019450 [Uroleucon formosanum]